MPALNKLSRILYIYLLIEMVNLHIILFVRPDSTKLLSFFEGKKKFVKTFLVIWDYNNP